jgi:serine/threonine protein kinase
MQPPIPLGTCLQNRYRLLKILGQGGFGRTYLAEDQGRFNEYCALKEWMPPQSGPDSLIKSQELFQREAAVLYQIQHPQIPQFRAFFEQEKRLFLVQDYVAGSTYRSLLQHHQKKQACFSEAEVRQLLLELLPVLDYIHAQGMIHRDISPDNIMLRETDHLPVLIDFGVVKEIATRFEDFGSGIRGTTVGKLGYSPSEQIQTGRAYPSSDLYALAVTAIVLLTGREPQGLFNDENLTWHWQDLASVRPSFAHIINRMLSQRPSDRYASAQEVIQALQGVPTGLQTNTLPTKNLPKSSKTISRMRTVAVGGRVVEPQPVHSLSKPPGSSVPVSNPAVAIESTASRSIWFNPLIWILVPIMSALGGWAVVSAFINNPLLQSWRGTATPSPTASSPTTPTASPTLTSSPLSPQVVQRRQLSLIPDELSVREGTLTAPLIYQFTAEPGQRLSINLTGDNVRFTLLGPNQEPLSTQTINILQWEGDLPESGTYGLRLSLTAEATQSDYRLETTVSNPVEATPTPTESPSPTDSPSPSPTESPSPSPTETSSPTPTESPSPTPLDPSTIIPIEPPTIFPNDEPTVLPQEGEASPGSENSSPPGSKLESLTIPRGKRDININSHVQGPNIKRYRLKSRKGERLRVEVVDGPVTLEIRDASGQVLESGLLEWRQAQMERATYEIGVVADQSTDFQLRIRTN